MIVLSGFNQVRFAHTDIQFPDFSAYRREGTKAVKNGTSNSDSRKAFTYMMLAGLWIHYSHLHIFCVIKTFLNLPFQGTIVHV